MTIPDFSSLVGVIVILFGKAEIYTLKSQYQVDKYIASAP